MRNLFDTRLKTVMPEMWPSKCNILVEVYETTDSNQEVLSGYSELIINIPCRIAVYDLYKPTDDEMRNATIEEKMVRRICKLNGNYPSILTRQMVAVVDGIRYVIRGVETDSQGFSTKLKLELITP